MAGQDEWVRITLRLPPGLHRALRSDARDQSLNAEIIARLEASYTDPIEGYENTEIFKQQMQNLLQRMTLLVEQLGLTDDSLRANRAKRLRLRRKAAKNLAASANDESES